MIARSYGFGPAINKSHPILLFFAGISTGPVGVRLLANCRDIANNRLSLCPT